MALAPIFAANPEWKVPNPSRHQHCHPLISIVTPSAKKNEFVFGFLIV
jgi:hypothetical protein